MMKWKMTNNHLFFFIYFIGDNMQKRRRLKPSIVKYIYKILIVIILTLVALILMKSSTTFKTNFYKYVYDTSFKFSDMKKIYHKYFGTVIKDGNINSEAVSSEKLNYQKKEKYQDGAKLSVASDYSIPIQESGIVVYIGKKDKYDKVVIIQQINGIDMWYGHISDTSLELYDYVTKGSILGNCHDYLYVVYKKDGKILPYEENL